MRTTVLKLAVCGCTLALSGCSIAGSWKRVATDPPGAAFPVDAITLDRDRNYTVTWSQDGRTRTCTGRYKWNGFTLELIRPGSRARSYSTRRRLDGKLVMTHEQGKAKVTAGLEKVDQ